MEKQTEDIVQSILVELKNYNDDGSERKIKLSMGFAYTYSSKGNMNMVFTQADKNMYKNKVKRKKDVLVETTN
jgi:GGDEF domain-containing protein